MKKSSPLWMVLCLLLLAAGAWLIWHFGGRPAMHSPSARLVRTAPRPGLPCNPSAAPKFPKQALASQATNQLALRLSNTREPLAQLIHNSHAILLENAFIDTSKPLNLAIPAHLRAKGDAGAYIVQAQGPIGTAFRATLSQFGATIVSYIPNNAYLVELDATNAAELAEEPAVQAVIPYQPYYKIDSLLLPRAVANHPLPDGKLLTLGLYADSANRTISEIENMGGQIVDNGGFNSPFGPVVTVRPPRNWTALTGLRGVQIVEPFLPRILANDLSRAEDAVAANSVTASNYMNLSGSNVLVEVDDSGIDTNHPDFKGAGVLRVLFNNPANGQDIDGHGTHVAGIIAGDGSESETVTNASGSIITNTAAFAGLPRNARHANPFQFRGMAPAARLFAMNFNDSDYDLQEAAAKTNAPISNNSWNFSGDNLYDLAAASYDAATRDALPEATGSQPVLFVFSAGNFGNGNNSGGGGSADTILSPATAKNVVTVGAIEELRDITNIVTDANSNQSAIWQPETDTSTEVASFSSRGNVGIGTEGPFGRFKPDVVAPGTFVVSTRSSEWDITNYFYQNPTNYDVQTYSGLIVQSGSTYSTGFPAISDNTIGVAINLYANPDSPSPFPTNLLPIYVGLTTSPGYDFFKTDGAVNIPPDGGAGYLDQIKNTETFDGFYYAVSNATTEPVDFDLTTTVITTNAVGNESLVLSNLDESIGVPNPLGTGPGPYYRYESGTSMSAADVSGALALMEDFFMNHSSLTNPSPALLKAMLINGARPTASYDLGVTNPINYEGWGLVNLSDSLPPAIWTNFDGAAPSSMFLQDQSPTNALATGDSRAYNVTLSTNAVNQGLRVTLAWTDPPGDPAAAVKLVNNLDLVVTNLDNGNVYFGNDIPAGALDNEAWNTNSITNAVNVADSVNNVEQVILPAPLGTNYSVTVIGRDVNVNAVTAQTNNAAGAYGPNTVQDYALVVSCGGGAVPDAIASVTMAGAIAFTNRVTDVTEVTNNDSAVGALMDQFVGASSPLMGTNQVSLGAGTPWSPEGAITLGETNQWHFYVVTNSPQNPSDFTNAAFITFLAPTLSVPRMGVFADSITNATRPEADIDLYVTTNANLLILDPAAVSGADKSVGRGGTEFVAYNNSSRGTVYYVGVKSEDQMASEYSFMAVFTRIPFSQNTNGNEVVNGIGLPAIIPDGAPTHPGITNILLLALTPIQIGDVVVTNVIFHQNFGDLIGTLEHKNTVTGGDVADVLNNHDALGTGTFTSVYDDGSTVPNPPARKSDGPGSLQSFVGMEGMGLWLLAEEDDSPGQTGVVENASMLLVRHHRLNKGVTASIAPGQVYYDFVDVPAGVTNLTIDATNITQPPDLANPLEMVLKFGSEPTLTDADKGPVLLNLGTPPGNSLSVGPADVPPIQPGRYWIGITNRSALTQTVYIVANLAYQGEGSLVDYTGSGFSPILDDAVAYSTNFVGSTLPVASVNVGIMVQHPRISDLIFHLISPNGTRVLLMENRGGADTNGAGAVAVTATTNVIPITPTLVTNVTFEGVTAADYTNGQSAGQWAVMANQVSVVADPLTANNGTNFLALANGVLSGAVATVPGSTYTLTLVCRGPGIVGWWRGESNYVNSVDGVAATNNEEQFVSGEVGDAFNFNGTTNYLTAPPSTSLAVSNLTLEAWVYSTDQSSERPVIDYSQSGRYAAIQFWINTTGFTSVNPGGIHAVIRYDPNSLEVDDGNDVVTMNQWHDIGFTVNATTGKGTIYCDGSSLNSGMATSTPVAPPSFEDVNIGYRDAMATELLAGYKFLGDLDEVSIYNRPLSDSEMLAIHSAGTAGKFDPVEFAVSPTESLAEANVSVNGQTPTTIYGDNTTWQARTIAFTATKSSTPIRISGADPGLLLSSVTVTNTGIADMQTNNLYLTFTEDTNLTLTPIKYAIPPFVPNTNTVGVLADSFEGYADGTYTTAFGPWDVNTNQVIITNNWPAYDGTNFLALTDGSVSTSLPTVAGQHYVLQYAQGVTPQELYVANYGNSTVEKFDLTGAGSPFVTANLSGPVYLEFHSNVLYVANYSLNTISEFDSSGAFLGAISSGVNGPRAAAFDNSGNLYVSNFGNDTIEKFVGGVPSVFASAGVYRPADIVFDSSGNLYLASIGTNVIERFNTSGAGTVFATGVGRHHGLAFDSSGYLYAADFDNNTIEKFDTNGNMSVFASTGVDQPYGLAFDGSGSLYVANWGNDTIEKFNANGVGSVFASAGLKKPIGMTFSDVGAVNADWQPVVTNFVATENGTTLLLQGLPPGTAANEGTNQMTLAFPTNTLLDAFNLTQVPGDLYYLPEESLDAFDGESAYGPWVLEIQDTRAGADLTNLIVSWKLDFTFAETNPVPGTLEGGLLQSNLFLPAADIAWYQVSVPTNASFATNILLYATAPVNVWFSTNSPPGITGIGDTNLIPGSTGGSATLTTNGLPFIVPGGTYYLGVQNTNGVTVNYGIEVLFDRGNVAGVSSVNISGIVVSATAITLNWTASPDAQFQVQWTDDLTQPWNTVSQAITSSDGNFTFTDDGSQTAPLGPQRFYRLVEIAP